MNYTTKERLCTFLLWGLAVYCVYNNIMFVRHIITHPEGVPFNSPLAWAYRLVHLAGIGVYAFMASPMRRQRISVNGLRLFQVFSGVFAGLITNFLTRLLALLFSSNDVFDLDYFIFGAMRNTVLFLLILLAAVIVTRAVYRLYGIKWLLLSFAITAALLLINNMLIHTALRTMPVEVFVGGAAFIACAIFFPTATQAVLAFLLALFVGIFEAVGGIMRK